eukprot:g31536.t1
MDGEILVAPVLSEDSKVEIYLPEGRWHPFDQAGQFVQGPLHFASKKVKLSEVPAFVRLGTVLTLAPATLASSQSLPGGPLEVQVYAGADGHFTLIEDDGRRRAAPVRRTSFAPGLPVDLGLGGTLSIGTARSLRQVSRSLAACEGALLVVDATQGVQAQTIANVTLAMEADLEIVPVLNKVDLPSADPERVCQEIEDVVGIDCSNALFCSAKTGQGVPEIIKRIIEQVPAPSVDETQERMRLLVYDSFYDNYRGVIAMFRVVDGSISKGQKIRFKASGKEFIVEEIGIMVGGLRKPVSRLSVGEVGYVCANIKTVGDARVGDTIIEAGTENEVEALPGYTEATPMVFCGLFPAESGDFENMKTAFERLSLNDAALFYEPENSVALGLGFRCGFLGVLHMEVIKDRLEREYDLDVVVTAPSVEYQVQMSDGTETTIQFANMLPPPHKVAEIREPYCLLEMIVPEEHMGPCMELATQRRGVYRTTNFLTQGRALLEYEVPMAEIIRDFFAELKSRSRGYASMDYRILDYRSNDLVKLEVDINQTTANPLAQIVHRSRALQFAKKITGILQNEIPSQQIKVIIQARIGTHIISSKLIKAVRKDVLAKCYGGDITRKKKLLAKQAAGKKKMQAIGKVNVPSEAILAVIKKT